MHHRIMVRRERESKSEIAGFGGFNLPFPAISNRLESEKETPAQWLRTLFTDDYVQFGSGETRALKGFPEPLRVYSVDGIGELSKWRISLARGTTPFVGRGEELSHLLSLANAAARDRVGPFVVVCGEPGVGKSRLVHETADALRASGWQSIQAECSP